MTERIETQDIQKPLQRSFSLTIVAPSHRTISCSAKTVMVPADSGYIGVMRGHQPILASLRVGVVKVTPIEGKEFWLAVTGGFFEMIGDNATLLADKLFEEEDLSPADKKKFEEGPFYQMDSYPDDLKKDQMAISFLLNRVN
ncbi:MAG: hypothetical protein HQM08_22515 [Candidatus Riflebacteria bacterium]|nr:hypothetical protein [Candidatus Riflebacteria bacterium]